MKSIIQTVSSASVTVQGKAVGAIRDGYLILLGVHESDTTANADAMARKIVNLRIFPDAQLQMNLSITDIRGEILLISQFTLYGDTNGGNPPSFIKTAKPDIAIPLYERVIQNLKNSGVTVETGKFGAMMEVSLVNQGPTTIILET